ncbi:NADH-quinone oxidoreductase subunit C [Sneathiella glossodoripedis]|uniref:NADH-quinone oxidoreductase subunit C n=1 Tax=Sneathiella glossodoripedis TaxID=418853 RepID=UPI000470581B|nr:NADH-quinone oxidoreductase subunit C [Sneathiella glossodoripedis]
MENALSELASHIEGELSTEVIETKIAHGELFVEVRADAIEKVLVFLRDDSSCKFQVLCDVCGVDYPERPQRFDVVYNLLSLKHNQRVTVKLKTDARTPVPSVVSLFPTANWFEREAWDMYGIMFSGHPDLRRMLTDYGFDGHPLRKDFPLTGHVEMRYSEDEKRVVYEPVSLVQEFRKFDFQSPWEGTEYVLPGDEKATEQS